MQGGDTKVDAYSRGYADFTKGLQPNDNPYPDGDYNAILWLQGWDYGMLLLQITPSYNTLPI